MLSKSASARREKRNLATAKRDDAGSLRPYVPPKYVTLGDAAAVAFVDGRSQRGKLCFVLLFLALQSAIRLRTTSLCVFVASVLTSWRRSGQVRRQIDIPGRHDDWALCRYEISKPVA